MNVGEKKQEQMGSEAAQHFTISGVALCVCVWCVVCVRIHSFLNMLNRCQTFPALSPSEPQGRVHSIRYTTQY